MFLLNPFRFAVAVPAFLVNATEYDGTNDFMTFGGDWTAGVDSKKLIISVWVKKTDSSVNHRWWGSVSFKHLFVHATDGIIAFILRNSASVKVVNYTATITKPDNVWYHILIGLDTGLATDAARLRVFIDDVEDTAIPTDLLADGLVDFTLDTAVGALVDGSTKWQGCISQLYFAPDQHLDFSIQANREKFILDGKPVDLGSDGSTPTGAQPLVYLKDGDEVNSGSEGNYTVTGALAVCPDSPSD